MDEIVDLFAGVYQAGRWPVSIYPDWLRVGLTFLVPIAFAVTVPAEAFTGRLTPGTLALAAAFAVGLLVVTRLLWRTGLATLLGRLRLTSSAAVYVTLHRPNGHDLSMRWSRGHTGSIEDRRSQGGGPAAGRLAAAWAGSRSRVGVGGGGGC